MAQESLVLRELALEKELAISRARNGLLEFIVSTFPSFAPSWHHARIATAVDALHDRCTTRQLLHRLGMDDRQIEWAAKREHEVTKLYCGMTNPDMLDKEVSNLQVWVSPRSGKTEIISRRTPAYWLGRRPDATMLACSFGADLAQSNNRDVQRIIDSDEYRQIFPGTTLAGSNVRTVASGAYLRNSDIFEIVNRKGLYKCSGTGGSITGRGINSLGLGVQDDLIRSREDAESPTKRHKLGDWLFGTWSTRLEAGAKQILLNTRWHNDDASGQTIAKAKKNPMSRQWFVLCFPALLDCEPGPGDPRKIGESLWPARYPESLLLEMKASNEYEFNAQHQQRPVSRTGGYVQNEWLRFYDSLPSDVVDWIISVDLAFKDRQYPCAFKVWARRGPDHFLVDCVNRRMAFDESMQTLLGLLQRYPKVRYTLVEEAANGAALINTLRKQVGGLIPIRPRTSKELRVAAIAPMFRAGNIHLPTGAPWTDEFILQLLNFPADAHDDMVDSLSQYALYASERGSTVHKVSGLSQPRAGAPRWR